MWDLVFFSAIFAISLLVLIKAADYFTLAAEKVGLFLGLSPFIIGVTIVSIGTSLPELIASILAVSKNSSEIVVGNVVGSNIANIFLVIGVASVMSHRYMKLDHDLVSVDLPLFVGSAFLLALTIWDGHFSTGEALLLVLAFVIYLLYTINSTNGPNAGQMPGELRKQFRDKKFLTKQVTILALSAAFIFLGANYTV
ncbi:MAG: sodium:calcium antiporter, partial [Cyanothece sp. SIO1E1]|nr:sodium:calcium antiporter [Cyanothece sp. SIO1E1]